MSLEKRLKKGYVKASRPGMPPVPLPPTRSKKIWERMKRGTKRIAELRKAHEEKQLEQAKKELKRQKTFLALERGRTKIAKARAKRKKYVGAAPMLGGPMAGARGGGGILANLARQNQVRRPPQQKEPKQKQQPKKRRPTILENLGGII